MNRTYGKLYQFHVPANDLKDFREWSKQHSKDFIASAAKLRWKCYPTTVKLLPAEGELSIGGESINGAYVKTQQYFIIWDTGEVESLYDFRTGFKRISAKLVRRKLLPNSCSETNNWRRR